MITVYLVLLRLRQKILISNHQKAFPYRNIIGKPQQKYRGKQRELGGWEREPHSISQVKVEKHSVMLGWRQDMTRWDDELVR